MKRFLPIVCTVFLFVACKDKKRNVPDVSAIQAPLAVERFERKVFALDSSHLDAGLNALNTQYSAFLGDYLYNILGLPPMPDSVRKVLPLFIRDYRAINDSVQAHFPDAVLDKAIEPLKKAMQLTKYYFPEYKAPQKLITYVGPLDGYGTVLTSSGFAVGLQLYMGAGFPLYRTDYVRQVYPDYASRRFTLEYIPVNCVKSMLDDLFPQQKQSGGLIEQMVTVGKKLFIAQALLPGVPDSLLVGYTSIQLQGCQEHEADIWNFFVENNYLYSTEPSLVRDYLNDGPNTPAFGASAPANIGEFVGWQIVRKWMDEHSKNSLQTLIETPSLDIFKQSKYKPH